MSNVAFAFDLHNTIMKSNDAWISAYIACGGECVRDQVTRAVYQKRSRRAIAHSIGVDYDAVYARYCSLVEPDSKMMRLLPALKGKLPLYLISSASRERVFHDLAVWNGADFFDVIYTKETFFKNSPDCWRKLLMEQNVDLLVYIGNDAKEDVPDCPGVISLICGDFLKNLDDLGLLIHREEVLR